MSDDRPVGLCEVCGINTPDVEKVGLMTKGEIVVCVVCASYMRTGILQSAIFRLKAQQEIREGN